MSSNLYYDKGAIYNRRKGKKAAEANGSAENSGDPGSAGTISPPKKAARKTAKKAVKKAPGKKAAKKRTK